ncbi:ArnT family glycosyltransferase [Bacteroidota bacterium]
MELHPDEAYQWVVSRYLDWGYFHHPPMIAAFIKIGYSLFQNELGVRLITVLASTLGIPILFKLSETEDVKTFLLIFLGLVLTHVGVFMAAPDSPLIFFTLVFLVLLKRYLEKDSIRVALALGVVVAALLYSKYHAIILLGSCIIAAPKLMLRRSFWVIVIISVILFLPHVLWQFQHDFISYKFNWVIREKKSWDITILLDYLAGQLLLLAPVGIFLILAISKYKHKSHFDRILVAIIIGVFGFFFVMGLRGKVEANWTAIAFLPLIILGSRALPNQPRLLRVFQPVTIVFISILILTRCYLATPWAGQGLPTVFPLKGWNQWALAIKEKAQGKPVFFTSSYQYASQYSFYSGEQGYHWSPLNYNGNQFELWDIDQKLEGQPFVIVTGFGNDSTKAVTTEGFRTMYVHPQVAYHSYRNLRFEFEESEIEKDAGIELVLNGTLRNQTASRINLDSLLSTRPVKVFFYINGKPLPSKRIKCNGCAGQLDTNETKPVSFVIQTPSEPGKYFFRFGLDFGLAMAEQNSDFIKLMVMKNKAVK